MLVIRLTTAKPFPTICFAIYCVLVEHCDSWIDHFCPCLGLQSPQGCVCVRVLSLPLPPLPKGREPKSDTLQLRRPCWVSHVQPGWLGSTNSGSLRHVVWMPASQSHWAGQPTSGRHKISELLFVILPAVFLAHQTHWIFNSYLSTCFHWIFAFSPYGGLASDTLG